MSIIKWSDSLSVNVEEIDLQHQKLVAMIDELADAVKLGKGNDVLGEILTGMVNYAATHFKTEEKYFEQFDYSEKDSHIEEHNSFTRKISDFQTKFENQESSLTFEIMEFLCLAYKSY